MSPSHHPQSLGRWYCLVSAVSRVPGDGGVSVSRVPGDGSSLSLPQEIVHGRWLRCFALSACLPLPQEMVTLLLLQMSQMKGFDVDSHMQLTAVLPQIGGCNSCHSSG